MSVELTKINTNCNNIMLLDLNECVGDGLEKLNNAYLFFAKAQSQMIDFITGIESGIPSFFAPISAKMLQTARLIDSVNKIYLNAYTTIQVLSSRWNAKEFTIYYPEILNIYSYYNNSSYYKDIIRDVILQAYFPAESLPENQKINVYISLSQLNTFSYTYFAQYNENCAPTAHSQNTLTCNGCGAYNETRNAGCNIDGRRCQNAYNFCGRGATTANGRYTCVGNISDTYAYNNLFSPSLYLKGVSGDMTIDYTIENIEDLFLARIVKLTGVIQNNQWVVT
jgi:hypothetical protein